jgi:hypothetical protein
MCSNHGVVAVVGDPYAVRVMHDTTVKKKNFSTRGRDGFLLVPYEPNPTVVMVQRYLVGRGPRISNMKVLTSLPYLLLRIQTFDVENPEKGWRLPQYDSANLPTFPQFSPRAQSFLLFGRFNRGNLKKVRVSSAKHAAQCALLMQDETIKSELRSSQYWSESRAWFMVNFSKHEGSKDVRVTVWGTICGATCVCVTWPAVPRLCDTAGGATSV